MHSSLRKKYIGNAAFYKMALAVAIPIMIQNGITNFVSLLDNIMVGRVGTEQMTGVAIVNQLIFVFNLAIFGAVSGAGIFGAQYYGKGDWDGVRQTFRFKLLVCTALTVLGAGIFLLFGEDLILLYLKGDGSPEQIAASLGYAKEYLLIMLVGFIPFTLSQCYSGTLRETGQTVVPMVAGVVSVVVNLCFNTLLIFGYLGFPRLGASGAAIATVIARFVEAGVVMLWAHRNPERVPYLRVLACNERGQKLLKTIKKTGSAPVLTKSADVRALSEEAQKLFALTARAADQYVLAYPELRAARGSSAWTEGPVIV